MALEIFFGIVTYLEFSEEQSRGEARGPYVSELS